MGYKKNIIQDKSYKFALKIIDAYKVLVHTEKEYVLSKQLLRSGTSIGANIEEAIGGYSKNEFAYRMSIAYKEARETMFWIKLLRDSEYLRICLIKTLLDDCEEICKILAKILITTKNNHYF